MHPALRQLMSLQELDLLAAHDTEFVARLPAELQALEKTEHARQDGIRQAEENLRQGELRLRQLDLEAKAQGERIAQLRARQATTRKNDEYQAIEHEVTLREKERAEIEERELVAIEEIESLRLALIKAREQFEPIRHQLSQRREELHAKTNAARERLALTLKKIAECRPLVDATLLERYDRLKAAGKKNALVALAHGNTCSGCHMVVTQQTILDARSSDRIGICEHCGRILYDPEFEAAAGSKSA